MHSEWWSYVESVIGDDAYASAAVRAGFDKSAFSRWRKGAKADPAFAVALARGYGVNVIEALVASGLLSDVEAGLTEVRVGARDAIAQATDEDLLRELLARVNRDGSLRDGEDFPEPAPLSEEEAREAEHERIIAALRNGVSIDTLGLAAHREPGAEDEDAALANPGA